MEVLTPWFPSTIKPVHDGEVHVVAESGWRVPKP